MARMVTRIKPQVVLPPVIGSYASLNLFVALVGPSGMGKGASEAAAADAVSFGQQLEVATVGSGEGIGHLYAHREKGEVIRDRESVLFTVPEVDGLVALGNRQGATLLPQLRSAWSGEQLGFSYADPTKRLPIDRHSYRMGLILGVQPARARPLLEDADGGTPQRFVWLPTTDPQAPETPPRCPVEWKWPGIYEPWFTEGYSGLSVMTIPPVARETIVRTHYERLRGEGNPLDGHALLCRLKVAAALCLLDTRQDVSDEDWELAGMVMRVSEATRNRVQAILASQTKEQNKFRALAEGERAVIVQEQVESAAVARVSRTILRALKRAEAGDREPIRDMRHVVASRDRQWVEAAVDALLDAGQIREESDGGKSCFKVVS